MSSITVALSIISIITSYIIIDHNLIISLCLLVIFFMTFMLTLIFYLQPRVSRDTGSGLDECANDANRECLQQRQPSPNEQMFFNASQPPPPPPPSIAPSSASRHSNMAHIEPILSGDIWSTMLIGDCRNQRK